MQGLANLRVGMNTGLKAVNTNPVVMDMWPAAGLELEGKVGGVIGGRFIKA